MAKLVGEHYLDYYAVQHSLFSVVLRHANVYGPRKIPPAEAGAVAFLGDCLMKGK